MYYEHFGLNYPPFKITPDTQMFYSGGKRGLVLEALVYAMTNGEGMVKVVGEVGSGKTMLCRMLAEKLPAHIDIIYLANPRLDPDTILQALALELKLPLAEQNPPPGRLQLMQGLHAALLQKHSAQRQVVVLVEEAQSMPLETLEEIRLLSNLETSRDKLLQIVLFGQPELDANLAGSAIRQLRERITHTFNLPPLNREDLRDYLEFRLHAAGYRGPSVFTPGAIKALHRASQGLLRRINILADKCLLAVFADNTHLVQARHVKLAVRDSGFLDYRPPTTRWRGALLTGLGVGLALLALPWLLERAQTLRPAAPVHAQTRAAPQAVAVAAAPVAASPPRSTETPATPAPLAVPVVETATPAPAPAETLPERVQQRLQATQAWLAQVTPQHYSIQLMQIEVEQVQNLDKFLASADAEPLRDRLYLYLTEQQQRRYWCILYAEFADADSAQAALNALPKSLQRNQPFLMTINRVLARRAG